MLPELMLWLLLKTQWAECADDPVRAPRQRVERVERTRGATRFLPPVRFYER